MADEKINIVVSLKDQASTSLSKIGKRFDELTARAKLLAVAGIGALAVIIKKSVDAFAEEEKAVIQLKAALRSTGQEVDNNAKSMIDYASELQRTTTVGDETSIALMQVATNMGLNSEQAKAATRDAIGLSKAYGVDTQAAIKAVTAAQLGDYNMLNRYIPSLRTVTDESEKAALAKRLLASAFNVAQSETKSFSGAMMQLNNSVGDAQEKIGAVFAPVIQKLATYISSLVNWFNDLNPTMQKNVVIFTTIGAAVLALIPFLGVLVGAIAAISWPVVAVVAAVGLLTAGFLMLSNEISSVGGVTNFLKNNFLTAIQLILEGFEILLERIKSIVDILNKIPGINIPIDDAIANIDALQQKLEEKKAKRIELETAEEDESRELALVKGEERNAALIAQQQAQAEQRKAYDEEMKAANLEKQIAEREALMAQREAWFQEDLAKLGSDEAAKAQLTAQYNRVRAADDKKVQDLQSKQKEQQSKDFSNWENFMLQATTSKNKEVAAVAKALAIKNIVFKTGEAAMSAYSSMAAIPFVGPVLGAAAAAAAIAFGAEQIQTVQSQGTAMADGGIVMPTPGGTQATIGEAGSAEAVIPLDDPEAKSMLGGAGGGNNITVNISGKPLAKEMYEIQQEMIRTGELSA